MDPQISACSDPTLKILPGIRKPQRQESIGVSQLGGFPSPISGSRSQGRGGGRVWQIAWGAPGAGAGMVGPGGWGMSPSPRPPGYLPTLSLHLHPGTRSLRGSQSERLTRNPGETAACLRPSSSYLWAPYNNDLASGQTRGSKKQQPENLLFKWPSLKGKL